MAEETKKVAAPTEAETPETLTPKAPELVEVELITPITINGVKYGPEKEYGDDEDPTPVTVKVPKDMAEDLKRIEREAERSRRDRFRSRKVGNHLDQ